MTHENVGRASQATACSENAITAGKEQATVMDVTDELKSWGDGLPRSDARQSYVMNFGFSE
ncbi:hypothetical protein [Cupriavidus pauculus]|uniref:hypothetical protein n=1 Tax=Cupriavidus pauculus TaxID=82633 RepID=UPI00124943BE|nr:hypothetical protein [Cupriavidus pauculus]KAB0601781.1 hypothetical protein F7R19_14880 [Cupriavidus pauculus]MCM3609591.1 hypothetical protein [Cupriavidus pauculus]UAL00211.1 hypothetical protein K8O84_02220 [Cupriavidus pauculus]